MAPETVAEVPGMVGKIFLDGGSVDILDGDGAHFRLFWSVGGRAL